MKVTFKLPFKYTTERTVRYGFEQGDGLPVNELFTDAYLQQNLLKQHFPDGKWPQEITITVEA